MGVCNLFKNLTTSNNGQGFFFTFSQYAEDLTMENTSQSYYRVIPSKFACLNINEDTSQTADNMNTIITNWNSIASSHTNEPNYALPQTLMGYYENAISHLRSGDGSYVWDNNNFTASAFLWNTLIKKKLVTVASETSSGTTYYYIPELKYVGDTNIYANENVQAINYNEIYCMIPADAKHYRYPLELSIIGATDYTVATDSSSNTHILNGWTSNYPTSTGLVNLGTFDSISQSAPYEFKYTVGSDSPISTSSTFVVPSELNVSGTIQPSIEQSSNSFDFNTIILFYDIYKEDGSVLKRNLPLGIWFSGSITPTTVTQGTHFTLNNKVTKYVRTDSAFDQGTSYGLRICTKYVATPFGSAVITETIDVDDLYPEFSRVCDEFAQSSLLINELLQNSSNQHSSIVEYLSQFANYKANVPYTIEIPSESGLYYWFVNGKNTGVVAGIDATTLQSLQTQISTLESRIEVLEQNL